MSGAKKRLLADVLWEAANVHLSPDGSRSGNQQWFSCNAVEVALDFVGWMTAFSRFPGVEIWLRDAGCPTKSNGCFGEYESGEERQGARYMWLLLAMHVAEDEGITV